MHESIKKKKTSEIELLVLAHPSEVMKAALLSFPFAVPQIRKKKEKDVFFSISAVAIKAIGDGAVVCKL